MEIGNDVREAVAAGRPVVALESTIFTHGLPRPRNLAVAAEAEEIVRAAGAVPATIGVVDGVPTVGLTPAQITRLATADGGETVKISERDLAVAVALGRSGGTTVAATAVLAHRAGIRVFATGGLGGVHRGAATTFDESADLLLLARTPILVVSAGVKSVLDVGATLERLETLSVAVVGYRTTSFPNFYLRDSGFAVESSVDSPEQAAAVVRARDALGVPGAVLLALPVADGLDPAEHDRVLAGALAAADAAGITGNAVTPFILEHVRRATGGRSLDVNVEVYRGNVTLAARVATALCGEKR